MEAATREISKAACLMAMDVSHQKNNFTLVNGSRASKKPKENFSRRKTMSSMYGNFKGEWKMAKEFNREGMGLFTMEIF